MNYDETQSFPEGQEPAPQDQETPEGTVPDLDQAPPVEGAETESNAQTVTHVFNPGDVATVVRGKYRQQKMTVVMFSAEDKTYAGKLENGTLIVVNGTNLKPPADSTISISALVGVLAKFQEGPESDQLVQRIAAALDEVAPEVSIKLNEARGAAV